MATNGFFGMIEGPFAANEEIFTKIQAQCKDTILYISKLGIHYVGNFDLETSGKRNEQIFVKINNIDFQIGSTRMLELQDVRITSIKFTNNISSSAYIDYQYVADTL